MPIQCFAANAAKTPLEPFQYEPQGLSPADVEIEITHCGVCHSDLHLVNNDWGFSKYPLVPGHEIVGKVISIGKSVTHLVAGQRVGVGWQRSACLICDDCVSGNENLCVKMKATCVGHFGGFAQSIRTDSRFAFPIPDELEDTVVAPLLCGGITVYSPLRAADIRPSMHIGVIGIGGLGSMALRFANAWGCEVTAFSSTSSKANDAKAMGAHNFVDPSDKRQFNRLTRSLDLIISTVPADLDWQWYLKLLKGNGKLVFVGVPRAPISIPAVMLIEGQKSIAGSNIGSRLAIREMLEFAARHKIGAVVETLPMSEVNTALKRLANNDVRFRFVLENG